MQSAPFIHRSTRSGLSPEHRQLLRGVSRSFDLSIRLLPAKLQAPVAIGYLLARATDTVADTTALPLAERQELLELMTRVIASPDIEAEQAREIKQLTQAFAAQQTDSNERALMHALPQCMPLLQTLDEADQASVRLVLSHITQGQHQDMARFGPGLHALNTQTELDHYTWQVAGSVGEFWTELCGRHLPGYALLAQDEMLRLGRRFGMGLQRLNILRDAGSDLAAGRCYWPLETLSTAGLNAEQLANAAKTAHASSLQALTPLYAQWIEHTQSQLADGMRYALALKPLRLRVASALPALIGARTLAMLRQSGPMALTQHIKMPRHEVRWLLWQMALGRGSAGALERLFKKLSGHDLA